MRTTHSVTTTSLLVLSCALCAAAAAAQQTDARALVIVVDGLRPDYVTPDLMPNLCREAGQGVVCEAHHSVIPTLTRVNSAALSTGCYPATNGLMDNTVYFPQVDAAKGLSTGDRAVLLKIEETLAAPVLTRPPMADLLADRGKRLLVASVGSSGSATLLNPGGRGAGTLHYEFALPETRRAHVVETVGPEPPDELPGGPRSQWLGDAYLKIGLAELAPDATILWFSDPDHTAHAKGIGSPETLEGIHLVDAQLGRIFAEHRERGLKVNVFVMSDHGFSTQIGGLNVSGVLVREGLKESARSSDVIVLGGVVYVNEGGDDRIRRIVHALQREPNAGAIFTRARAAGSHEGFVPGTLSFDLMHWNHARAADVWVGNRWTNEKNEYGYPGKTTKSGKAGHGSMSPWDIHTTLIAFGPDIKSGTRNPLPSATVDIAPTVAHLLGTDAYEGMDGRVLHEVLRGQADPDAAEVEELTYTATTEDGSYTATVSTSTLAGKRYVNHSKATRN